MKRQQTYAHFYRDADVDFGKRRVLQIEALIGAECVRSREKLATYRIVGKVLRSSIYKYPRGC